MDEKKPIAIVDVDNESGFIEVRCKTCRRFFLEASIGASGVFRHKCKGCKRYAVFTMPIKNAQAKAVYV